MRTEYYKRGIFGWLTKISFIAFNLFMAGWLLVYWADVANLINAADSEAARAGAAIGFSIGIGVILFLWVSGAIILGLLTYFTRGKKVILEPGEERGKSRARAGIVLAAVAVALTLTFIGAHWLPVSNRLVTPMSATVSEPAAPQHAPVSQLVTATTTSPAQKIETEIRNPTTATPPATGWVVTQERSKIDDLSNEYLHLSSKEPIENQFHELTPLELWITCREGKTDLYLVFGGHFMASIESYGTVTYRIDKSPAEKRQFTEFTDHKALGLWRGQGIPLIKEMFDASNLFVRATPYNESPVTGEFNISALKEAIKPLRAACGWDRTPPSALQKPSGPKPDETQGASTSQRCFNGATWVNCRSDAK